MVYIAGDTLTYRELADVMQAHWGVEVNRVLLNKERLQEEVLNHPRDVGAKYRLAFARPDGVARDKAKTFNARRYSHHHRRAVAGAAMPDLAGRLVA